MSPPDLEVVSKSAKHLSKRPKLKVIGFLPEFGQFTVRLLLLHDPLHVFDPCNKFTGRICNSSEFRPGSK